MINKTFKFVLIVLLILFLVSSISALCIDSDLGDNYYLNGVISNNEKDLFGKFKNLQEQDFCQRNIFLQNTGKLMEYSCENEKIKSKIFKCPYGCEDGVCVSYERYLENKNEINGFLNSIFSPMKSFLEIFGISNIGGTGGSDSYCTPSCIGKQCGSNGCGSDDYNSCGTCSFGQTCQNGQCVGQCAPSCINKQCGNNGCGGSCGTCDNLHFCDLTGNCKIKPGCEYCDDQNLCTSDNCYPSGEVRCTHFPINCPSGTWCNPSSGECGNTCFPDCRDKQCGTDGCVGLCGECGQNENCLGGSCYSKPICSDTDKDNNHQDGFNTQVKGTASGETIFEWSSGQGWKEHVDYCIPGNFSNNDSLMEYYCSGDYVDTKVVKCKNPCDNGQCIDVDCVPKTCGGTKQCGIFEDGCGGKIDCGNCSVSGNTCVQGLCNSDGLNFGTCNYNQIPNCQYCTSDSSCISGDKCKFGKCVGNICSYEILNYEDNNSCTIDSCNIVTGVSHIQKNCNDNNACTTDSCNSDSGNCIYTTILNCGSGGGGCIPKTCISLGKSCGSWDNGCGTNINCGSCSLGKVCNSTGQCIGSQIQTETPCTANCTGKQCGNNGCGGSCGTCPVGQSCNSTGKCVFGCISKTCSQLAKQCGIWDNGCGTNISCGNCGSIYTGLGQYIIQTCNFTGQCCTPNCINTDGTTKQCGDNGCGGNCGTCPTGQTCDTNGACVLECTNKRIFGNVSSINTSISELKVLVDGKNLTDGCFEGIHEMIIYHRNNPVVSFVHNFSAKEFYLNKITLDVNYGFVNIDLGEQLLDGESKTIYVNLNTSQAIGLCLKDSKVKSYFDFSDNCSSPDEIDLKDCIGKNEYKNRDITCRDENDRFVFSGLKHSAEKTGIPCCSESDCNPVYRVLNSYQTYLDVYSAPCMTCSQNTHTCVAKKSGASCIKSSYDSYSGICEGGECKVKGENVAYWLKYSCNIPSIEYPPKQVIFSWGYSVGQMFNPDGTSNNGVSIDKKTRDILNADCDKDYECGDIANCVAENGIKRCVLKCDHRCEVEVISPLNNGQCNEFVKCKSKCTGEKEKCIIDQNNAGNCVECGKDSDCGSGEICLGSKCVPSNSYCLVSSDCPPGNICQFTDKFGYCALGTECDANRPCRYGTICVDGKCDRDVMAGCSTDSGNCDKKSCMYYNANTKQCQSMCNGVGVSCKFNPGAETGFCFSESTLCSACEKYDPVSKTCVDNSGPCHECEKGIIKNLCNGCEKCDASTDPKGKCVSACLDGKVCWTNTVDQTKYCQNKYSKDKLGFYSWGENFETLPPHCNLCNPANSYQYSGIGGTLGPCDGKECQDLGGCIGLCGPKVGTMVGGGGNCEGDSIVQKQAYCANGKVEYETTTLVNCKTKGPDYTCQLVWVRNGPSDYLGHQESQCVQNCSPIEKVIKTETREGICGEDFYCQNCEKCSDDKKSCVPNPPCDKTKCQTSSCTENKDPLSGIITSVDKKCLDPPTDCNCIDSKCRNCKKNSDCKTNELCIEGKCEKNMCIDDNNCPDGMNCLPYLSEKNDYGKCVTSNCTYDSDCGNENMICSKDANGNGNCRDKNCLYIPNAVSSQYCGTGKVCKQGLQCSGTNECQPGSCIVSYGLYGGFGGFSCPAGLKTFLSGMGGMSGYCKCVECIQTKDCANSYTCSSDHKCIKNISSNPPPIMNGNGITCPLLPNGDPDPSCPNGGCQFCTSNEIEIFNPGSQNKFCADNCNQGDCMKLNSGTGQCEYSCGNCETCNSGICVPKCDPKKEDCLMKDTKDANGNTVTNFVCEAKPAKLPDIYTITTYEWNCQTSERKSVCTPKCTNKDGTPKPDGASNECGGYCGTCKEEYSCVQGEDGVQRIAFNKKEWVKKVNTGSNTLNSNVINNEGLSSKNPISSWIRLIINFITGKTITGNVISDLDVIAECKISGDPVYQETCGECQTCMPEECGTCTGDSCKIEGATPLTCRADADLEEMSCGSTSTGTKVKDLVFQGNSNCPLCDNINPPKEGFCKSGKCVSEIPENFCVNEPSGTNALTEYKFIEVINIIKSGNSKEIQDNIDLLDTKLINANFPNPASTNEDIENYLKIISLWIDSFQYGKIREFPPLYGKRTNNGPLIKCSDIIPYCSSSPYQDDQYWPEEILEFIREYYLEKKNSNTNFGDREEINYIRTTLLLGSYYAHYAEFGPPLGHPITDRTDYPINENRRNFYFTASERYYNYIDQYLPDKNIDRSELYSAIADLKMIEFKHYRDYDNLLQNDINPISSIQLQILVSKQKERIQSLNAVLQYRKAALDSVPINSNNFKSKTQLYKSRLLQTKKDIVDSMMKILDSSLKENWENFKDRFPLEGPTYANEKTLRDYTSKWIQYYFAKNQVFRTIQSLWSIGVEDATKNSDKNEKVINSMKISLSIIRLMLEKGYDLNEYKTLPAEDKLKLIRDVYDPGFSNDSLTKCITLTNNPNFQNTPYTASVDEIKRCMGLYLIKCNLEITMNHFSDIKILLQDGNIDGMDKIFDLEKDTSTWDNPTTLPLDYQLPVYQFKFIGKEKIVNNGKLGEQKYYYLLNYPYSPESDYERMDIEYQLTELTPVRLANKFVMAYYSLKIPGIIINAFESGGILLATKTSAHILGTVAIFQGGNYALEEYIDPSGTAGDVFGIALIGADLFRFGKALYLGKNEKGYVELFGKFENIQSGKNYISYLESIGAKVETTPGNDFEYKINGKRFRILLDAPPTGAQDLSDFINFVNAIAKKAPEIPKYPDGVELVKDTENINRAADFVEKGYDRGRESSNNICDEQQEGLRVVAKDIADKVRAQSGDADTFLVENRRTATIFKSDVSELLSSELGKIAMELGRTAVNRDIELTKSQQNFDMARLFYSAFLRAKERGADLIVTVTIIHDAKFYRYFFRKAGIIDGTEIMKSHPDFLRTNNIIEENGHLIKIIEVGPPRKIMQFEVTIYDVDKSLEILRDAFKSRCK